MPNDLRADPNGTTITTGANPNPNPEAGAETIERLAVTAAVHTVAEFMAEAHMWTAFEIVNGERVTVTRDVLSRQRDDSRIGDVAAELPLDRRNRLIAAGKWPPGGVA